MNNENNLPKVSVIIPLFNQKKFINDTVQSVLKQSYENIEIIVVNDGSTDNPKPMLDKFENKIIVIDQKNRGLAGARNTGIRRASGEYIQLLDADDLLEENKIKKQLQLMNRKKDELSYCRIDLLNNGDKKISNRITYAFEDVFSHYYLLWKPYPTPIHSLIFHKTIFEDHGLFEESLKANEDRYFLAKLAYSGIKFRFLPFTGGFYRKHMESMNADPLFMAEAMIDFYKTINSDLSDRFLMDKYGYSGCRMMRANITYFYLVNLRNCTSGKILKNIKKILKKEGIEFYADPLESRFSTHKLQKMIVSCYFKRYLNKLSGIFPKKTGIEE